MSICKNLINSPTKLNAAKAVNGPALQKENNNPPHYPVPAMLTVTAQAICEPVIGFIIAGQTYVLKPQLTDIESLTITSDWSIEMT